MSLCCKSTDCDNHNIYARGLCQKHYQRLRRSGGCKKNTREKTTKNIARQAKACTKCGQLKPFSDYWVHSGAADGRQSQCISCLAMPEIRREHKLQRAYGIGVEEYNQLLTDQGGVCCICQKECSSGRQLAVDHNHQTDKVRGLLCGNCNVGIGNLKDDPNLLRLAAEYLEKN